MRGYEITPSHPSTSLFKPTAHHRPQTYQSLQHSLQHLLQLRHNYLIVEGYSQSYEWFTNA